MCILLTLLIDNVLARGYQFEYVHKTHICISFIIVDYLFDLPDVADRGIIVKIFKAGSDKYLYQ